jgi:hypothetical protein
MTQKIMLLNQNDDTYTCVSKSSWPDLILIKMILLYYDSYTHNDMSNNITSTDVLFDRLLGGKGKNNNTKL